MIFPYKIELKLFNCLALLLNFSRFFTQLVRQQTRLEQTPCHPPRHARTRTPASSAPLCTPRPPPPMQKHVSTTYKGRPRFLGCRNRASTRPRYFNPWPTLPWRLRDLSGTRYVPRTSLSKSKLARSCWLCRGGITSSTYSRGYSTRIWAASEARRCTSIFLLP